jgi:E3 Ubiquitin ligase
MIALIVPAIVSLFGLIFGGVMVFMAIRARNRLKLIEAAPLCKADQLITGLAKMRGKIAALDEDDLLTSPMTKTVCVYFRFLIQEERTRTVTSYQNGRNVTRTERYWHTVVDDIQTVPTAVQDKTGDALVDLTAAELTLKAMQATSGTFKSVPASLERTLQKRYGVSGKGLIFNKNMRYTESVIEQGAKVFVVGDCKMKKSGTPSFFRGDHPLLVTDKNEEELVGHYKKRFIGFLIAGIAVPILLIAVGCFIGFFMWKNQHPKRAMLPRPQVVVVSEQRSLLPAG